MPAALLPLSAAVLDVLALGHDMLTPIEAGRVIGRAATTMSEACARGEIEAQSSCVRGRGSRKRWSFSRAALLAYIWKNTTGDKALMRAALQQHAPALLAHLEGAAPQVLPDNAIPFPAAKRTRRADPLAGAIGDLFAHANAG